MIKELSLRIVILIEKSGIYSRFSHQDSYRCRSDWIDKSLLREDRQVRLSLIEMAI